MFIAPRRKPRIKTRMTYGLALAAMAATFSALQAYADDSMQPATDKPPQIAAPANNMAPPAPAVAPMGTTKVLGTLPAGGGQPTAVPLRRCRRHRCRLLCLPALPRRQRYPSSHR